MTILQSAKCVYVPLKPKLDQENGQINESMSSNDWSWNMNELKAAFTSKTKVIVINTPNNPLGKVYSKEELEIIAELCIKHNVICISDEVYEHIVYDKKHISIGINYQFIIQANLNL
jgi:kynurenine--oxoglutarate transaminase/cysteine-S-conjugate beta-lyase/glutamine--phenylpyruvate transaminase